MNARCKLGAIVAVALALSPALQACAAGTPAASSVAGTTAAAAKANGSGIAVHYRIEAEPQAGRAVPVVLSFDGVTDAAGATVRLAADAGLSLAAASAAMRTLPAGEATTWTVQVVPAATGIGYLHVFTTQHGATSATSIPVQVGKAPAALPSSRELKPAPDGDKILSMPVK